MGGRHQSECPADIIGIRIYSDKHGIFRVNAKDAAGGERATQLAVP